MNLTKEQSFQEAAYSFPYHYSDLLGGIHKLNNIPYLHRLEMVKQLIHPFNGQYVLDAGCGDGRLCYELRKENVKVTGADMSERAISFARAFNPDVNFYVQDLENLNIPYTFDYIILMETLEHVIPEKIDAVLRNNSRQLKDGGKLIITVPSTNRPLEAKHYQHFTEEKLAQTIKPHFDAVQIFGYDVAGNNRSVFTNLSRLGILLSPFSSRFKFVDRYYSFLYNFYSKKIGIGDPEHCTGIVAVCKKATLT